MKKLLLMAAAAAFMATSTQAQDVYKQTGGENNLEVLFTPLGGSPIGINGIKFRKFTSASTALRMNVFIGFSSSGDKHMGSNAAGEDVDLKDTQSNFNFSIAPGIEKHFAGTDRLSPYVGAEVLLGFGSDKSVEEMQMLSDDKTTTTTTSGSFTGGLNAFAGVDYYFSHDIYIGAELGFGFAFQAMFDETQKTTDMDDVVTPGGSAFDIGPNAVAAIRAGFLF